MSINSKDFQRSKCKENCKNKMHLSFKTESDILKGKNRKWLKKLMKLERRLLKLLRSKNKRKKIYRSSDWLSNKKKKNYRENKRKFNNKNFNKKKTWLSLKCLKYKSQYLKLTLPNKQYSNLDNSINYRNNRHRSTIPIRF